MKIPRLWSLGAALAMITLSANADVVVIVHPKNPTTSMTAEQVAAIFLGKTMMLPNGGTAAVVDQPESSPLHEAFYAKVAGKTQAQVKATWARLSFSGRAIPPKALDNSAEVRKFVANNPEAIGYVEKSAVDASVKAVLKVE